jgi:hypothetical protein
MIAIGGLGILGFLNAGRWLLFNAAGGMVLLLVIGCWSLIGAGILNQIKRPILGAVLGVIPGLLFAAYTFPIPC